MNYRKLLKTSAGIVSEKLLGIFPPYIFPFSEKILEQFFVYKLRKQQFEAVKDFCKKLSEKDFLPEKLKKISSGYYCKACLDNNPDPSVLGSLSTSYQKKTNLAIEALRENDKTSAENSFINALDNACFPERAKENLVKTFNLLTGELSAFHKKYSDPEAVSIPVKSSEKIILSGMNWSGTGALYDYFREFDCVKALPGEQRLWKESDYSLLWGYNNQEKLDRNTFLEYLLRLFFIPMTGLNMPRNWQDVFGSNVGFENIRKDKSGFYSSALYVFLREIIILKSKGMLDNDSFLKAAVELTDRIFNALSDNFEGYILPDNAVHLSDIEPFRFFSSGYLICVFRDPRSNYAARFHENVRFNRDSKAFVKYYRETRESFIRKKGELKEFSDHIIEVQFEEFILSEEFRNNLALKLGLDFSGWKKQRYFKPHISEKNVHNYKKFHDKKTMDFIAESLGEYCL